MRARDIDRPIELVVGLGNPGLRYAASRHNLGFRVVDEFALSHADADWIRRPLCHLTTAPFGPRLILAKPQTFMNRSGDAVAWLLDLLDISTDQLLVVVDDVDLPLGRLRLRSAGGPGTHNGLRHIGERVGTGFARLRVGVRGSEPWQELADYVLAPFEDDELTSADEAIRRAADALETTLTQGLAKAMEEYNRRPDE
jgi:PTH1 family peptidyl-tRNA hydrolase